MVASNGTVQPHDSIYTANKFPTIWLQRVQLICGYVKIISKLVAQRLKARIQPHCQCRCLNFMTKNAKREIRKIYSTVFFSSWWCASLRGSLWPIHTQTHMLWRGYIWPPLHTDAHSEYLQDAAHSKQTMCSKGLRDNGMKQREKLLLLLFEWISDRLLGSAMPVVLCILTRFVFFSFFSLPCVSLTFSNKMLAVFAKSWHSPFIFKGKPYLVLASMKMNGLDLSADEVTFNVRNLFVFGSVKHF